MWRYLMDFEGYTISIHALREERDSDPNQYERTAEISIHALREERDIRSSRVFSSAFYFNPRAPRGARRPPPCLQVSL